MDIATPDVTPIPGKPNLLLGAFGLENLGYRADEFFMSGSASSYAPVAGLGADGRWDAAPSESADYTTRIVAVTPTDPAKFNGTVIVEWLNVSGGIDAPALWMMAHREMIREGYAFVGVSAQSVGVEGGGVTLVSNFALKTVNPERYSSLSHPGDAFSFDIFSQVGRLAREGDNSGILGGLQPEQVLAVGESQSAMFLTTYINAVDAIAKVYDGFLVHSRFGPAAPLDGTTVLDASGEATHHLVPFRTDLRVPVMAVITETDLIGDVLPGYHTVTQPDNDLLRVWEIPGAAHADNYTIHAAFIDSGSTPLADLVAAFKPTNHLLGQDLAHNINFGPQHHYVVQAALAKLHSWSRDGNPAPTAPRLALSETSPPEFVVDENGITKGGVRTPWVDVPVARTSGLIDDGDVMAAIFGSGEVFDAATLAALYPGGKDDYLARFTEALDGAVAAGFIVAADRAEILELAAATYPGG